MGISQEGDTLEPDAVEPAVKIDRARSARRIEEVLEEVSGPRYTRSKTTICRYAFTPEYADTVRYFATALEGLGYQTREDPVGNFIARNRPDGEPTYGVGSHCDSNRNGGRYDGTLGVVAALELCRLDSELDLGLPLQVVIPVEEEASGFGHAMLGSAIMITDPVFGGLAVSLIFGTFASTALTLVVIPLMYYLWQRNLKTV